MVGIYENFMLYLAECLGDVFDQRFSVTNKKATKSPKRR
jgi:hypothetical protein